MNEHDDYEASGLSDLIADAHRHTRRYVNDLADDARMTSAAIAEADAAMRDVYDSMGRLMSQCAPVLVQRLNAYTPTLPPPTPRVVEELDPPAGLIRPPEYQPTDEDIARIANELDDMPRIFAGPLKRRLAG